MKQLKAVCNTLVYRLCTACTHRDETTVLVKSSKRVRRKQMKVKDALLLMIAFANLIVTVIATELTFS